MKMRPYFFAAFIWALSGPSAWAAFDSALISPRSAGMANSDLASSDDSAGIFANPAAIASLKATDLYFVHSRLFAGLEGIGTLSEGFFTGAFPTRYGNFGVGYGNFSASGLLTERTLALTYARSFRNLQFGVTTKRLSRENQIDGDALAAADPVFANGTSRAAWAMDLGFSAVIRSPLKVAFAIRNLNAPNLGLASEDKVAREFEGGVSLEWPGLGMVATSNLAFRDTGFGSGRDRVLLSLGLEKALFSDRFALRVGANPLEFGAGMGLMLNRMGFDYSMTVKRQLFEAGAVSHRLGLRLRFGGPAQTSYARDPLDDESHPVGPVSGL
jgi:hypothetical protein